MLRSQKRKDDEKSVRDREEALLGTLVDEREKKFCLLHSWRREDAMLDTLAEGGRDELLA